MESRPTFKQKLHVTRTVPHVIFD